MPSLPAGLDPLAPALGLAGLIWGLAADRIAARWPAHEDGAVRKVDWRTPVVAVFAAVALAALPLRFGDPGQRLLFGVFFAAWALAMATDLDQRLIPDVITLSLIVLGAAALVWGGDSLVSRSPAWTAVMGAVAVPGLMLAASLPWRGRQVPRVRGPLGRADTDRHRGLCRRDDRGRRRRGSTVGAARHAQELRPFGPFLILGALWAVLLPASS